MKRIISLLALAAALLALPGCSALLERSYSGAESHVDYAVEEDDSILRAETYQGLLNSILYFVNEHSTSGSIRLYNYDGDVEADLERARAAVTGQDPLAAYAVRTLSCEPTRILTYYEVDVRISYAHTAGEIEAIRPVAGLPGLRAALSDMIDQRLDEDVFLLSYVTGDGASMEALGRQLLLGRPELWLPSGAPDLRFELWPEEGVRRVTRVTSRWSAGAEETAGYAAQLEAAADLLLAAAPPAGEGYTVEELAAIVRSASGPLEAGGSGAALDVLRGKSASETGLLLALEALCQRAGLEVIPVTGEAGGDWLIAAVEGGYRHVLPADYAPGEDGEDGEEPWALPLYTDEELTALGGRVWQAAYYPTCQAPAAPDPSPSPGQPE